jgi:hypothetical protein
VTRPFISIAAEAYAQASTRPPGGVKWCSECEHDVEITDPYEIGETWRTAHECGAEICPHGKLAIDQE